MEQFEWAQNNLGVDTPEELQSRGVNVFFAPNIDRDCRVVNLENGRVDWIRLSEHRPESGYYADWESLTRYCRQEEIPLSETDGQVSVQPVGHDDAGNPLLHGQS